MFSFSADSNEPIINRIAGGETLGLHLSPFSHDRQEHNVNVGSKPASSVLRDSSEELVLIFCTRVCMYQGTSSIDTELPEPYRSPCSLRSGACSKA